MDCVELNPEGKIDYIEFSEMFYESAKSIGFSMAVLFTNLSEHIIPSNMLDKWKLQDDGTMLAKSRNVLIGWKDPMIYQLERRAPTPTQEGIMVMLQWLASFRVSGRISDLTNAFGQSRKTNRVVNLAIELPTGVKHPSLLLGCP